MIYPDLVDVIQRLRPLSLVQNIPFKYQPHLWQVSNISKKLLHSFRGRMLDDYLEHYKGITKSISTQTLTMHESIWKNL